MLAILLLEQIAICDYNRGGRIFSGNCPLIQDLCFAVLDFVASDLVMVSSYLKYDVVFYEKVASDFVVFYEKVIEI